MMYVIVVYVWASVSVCVVDPQNIFNIIRYRHIGTLCKTYFGQLKMGNMHFLVVAFGKKLMKRAIDMEYY